MKPVYQSITKHDPDNGQIGDCFRACICSLLELPIEKVPHFVLLPEADWWKRFVVYMEAQGYKVFCGFGAWSEPIEKVYFYIATGTSPRGFLHSVIYSQGNLIHDPHPDGGGVTNIIDYTWLEKINGLAEEVA